VIGKHLRLCVIGSLAVCVVELSESCLFMSDDVLCQGTVEADG